MPEASGLSVSVVYAEPQRVFDVRVSLPNGATVADAIARSGIREQRPDIEIRDDRLGIFARKALPATELQIGRAHV